MIRRPIVFLPLLAIIAVIAFFFLRTNDDFPSGKPGPEVVVTIQNGALGSEIAATLQNTSVIKKASAYIRLANKDSRTLGVSPGDHRIQTRLPVKEALNQLLDQRRFVGQVEVKEGSTLSDVLKTLKASKNIDQKTMVTKSSVTPALKNSLNSLEGQLFPARYSFAPGTTYVTALSTMVHRFQEEVTTTGLNKGFQKYSPYQALIIASMVQIEGDPTDFGKVARTIYNRLKIGMPLQLNSTVQYAANLRGRIALSTAATQIRSPYNTYRNVGLPPTPISNPSTLAIKATLSPDQGDWLYFITVKPGDTRFTSQYSEFQQWEVLYTRNLRAGAFK